MIKNKCKDVKPSSHHIHLIYRCPSCAAEHWLSLKATTTKGFKVVCDCDTVFKIKRVKGIKIIYEEVTPVVSIVEPEKTIVEDVKQEIQQEIGIDLLEKCCKILESYGFTKLESKTIIRKTFEDNPSEDCSALIKSALLTIGELKS